VRWSDEELPRKLKSEVWDGYFSDEQEAREHRQRLREKILPLWRAIRATLLSGNAEEIAMVACPNCGGELNYQYLPNGDCADIRCVECGVAAPDDLGQG
jgi:hypothetical protein